MLIYNNARRGSLLEQSDCFGFSASFHYKGRWGYKETQSHTYRGFSRLSREQDRMDETTTNILRQNLFFKRECIQFSSFFSWRKQKHSYDILLFNDLIVVVYCADFHCLPYTLLESLFLITTSVPPVLSIVAPRYRKFVFYFLVV